MYTTTFVTKIFTTAALHVVTASRSLNPKTTVGTLLKLFVLS